MSARQLQCFIVDETLRRALLASRSLNHRRRAGRDRLLAERFEGSADDGSELLSVYGVRAHNYAGLFDGSNEAEYAFLDALPDATAFINQQAKANGVAMTVTEAELALNFIAEGAYFALNDDLLDGLDGYQFGIDTLVNNQDAIKPWLHPSVIALLGTDHVVA